MEPTQPQPLAIWNSARDVWETPATEGFFCEHLDVFSETFPTSGMTVNGAAYALPTWEPATDDTESSSLLPTVTTSEATGPGNGPKKTGGDNLRTVISIMPTPMAQNGTDRNSTIYRRPLDQPQNLENALALLPTPKASGERNRLLPTPTSERPDARKSEAFSKGRATFFDIIQNVQWGEYEPAIRRWEHVFERTAPAPTEPTGRDGGQRLSPRFTEWMMGLPDGWVTAPEIGLTRNEQLKACGNGVVPQQSIAALQDMANYKKGEP